MSEGFTPNHDTIDADKIREHDGTPTPWIKTSDTPPPEDGTALMGYRSDMTGVYFTRYHCGVWRLRAGTYMIGAPLYWMPIPELPKEGE